MYYVSYTFSTIQEGVNMMKLKKLKLKNWRCFKEEVEIEFDDLTALIGSNDAGKSSILDALNVFFEHVKPDPDDANIEGDAKDVRICCVFSNLPEKLVIDAQNETDLESEHLLNSDGMLEVWKIYNCSLKTPKETKIYAMAEHPNAENVGDLLTLKRTQLQGRANDLGVDITNVDERINADLRKAIRDHVNDLAVQLVEVPLQEEDAKKIWEQLKKYLPVFALFKSDRQSTDQDSEAQDPILSSVKEALKEKEAELSVITDHVIDEVTKIAALTVEKIKEMSPKLAEELKPRIKANPKWDNIFKFSLVGDDQIPMNKRGSGVRRLILINFFRAKAEQDASKEGKVDVIYAIEEPETSQHPINQKLLLEAFEEISEAGNSQIIISSHLPMLAKRLPVKSLRFIQNEDGCDPIIHSGTNDTYTLIVKSLGLLPGHDVKLFIGVEGPNDINFLRNISRILNMSDEKIPDLGKNEQDGKIIFIPLGGSNLVLWTTRLAGLNIPECHIYDRDTDDASPSPHQDAADELVRRREDAHAIITGKREIENYIHSTAITAIKPELTVSFGDYDDVPRLCAKALHDISESTYAWDELDEDRKSKKISSAKKWLNKGAAGEMTPELLDEVDPNGDVRGWMGEIKDMMDIDI